MRHTSANCPPLFYSQTFNKLSLMLSSRKLILLQNLQRRVSSSSSSSSSSKYYCCSSSSPKDYNDKDIGKRGNNKTKQERTCETNYLYHGRKRFCHPTITQSHNNKLFPFTNEHLNFDGVEATISEIEKIIIGGEMIGPERIKRIEAVLKKRTFSILPILENVYDMGNFLAVCRSAEALGIGAIGIISEKGQVFKQSGRTSGGAVKWQDVQQYCDTKEAIENAKNRGYRVLVTDFSNNENALSLPVTSYDFTEPTAIIFGNELEGVSEQAKSLADGFVYVPMSGFTESFNLSVSASILLSHATYDRKTRIGNGEKYEEELAEDEIRLLRAVFLSRSVANYSRPKYMKSLIEHLRNDIESGDEIVFDYKNKNKHNDENNEQHSEDDDVFALHKILEPSKILKRGRFVE